jgi:hypothetical protein
MEVRLEFYTLASCAPATDQRLHAGSPSLGRWSSYTRREKGTRSPAAGGLVPGLGVDGARPLGRACRLVRGADVRGVFQKIYTQETKNDRSSSILSRHPADDETEHGAAENENRAGVLRFKARQ